MAVKIKANGTRGLNFTATLNINEAKKAAQDLKKTLSDLGVSTAKAWDVKPMTAYQAEQIKIKQEALEFAKQKQEQARADKAASLATQQALREERELIKQRNAEAAKRVTSVSDSVPEVANYNNSTNGTNGKVNTAFTAYLKEVKKDFDSGKISASEYVAELERYSTVSIQNTNTTKQATTQTKQLSASKKELAQDLAIEKLKQQEATAALKNNAREMLNEKGSLENRRAALIRLTATYDRLNKTQRETPSGQRLQTIIDNLSKTVGELELKTNRGQRNVGQYPNKFAEGLGKVWGGLKLIANILPGLGIAGLLAFAIDPLVEYIKGLDLFKYKITEAKVAQEDMAKALAGGEYGKAVSNVNELRINIDLAKQGLISKESVLKQYNETIGKTTGQVSNLDQAERELNKNADAFIKVTLLKAAAQVALESAAKSAYEAEITRRKKLEEFSSITDNFGPGNLEGINTVTGEVDEKKRAARAARIKAQREKERKDAAKISQDSADQQIAIAKKFQQDAAKISTSRGYVNFLGNDDPAKTVKNAQAGIASQRSLQAEIDALTKRGANKRLDADAQELADADIKYDRLREKAIQFNKDVDKYNADARNKIKRNPVNLSGLNEAQSAERDNLVDKQAANKLKDNIDQQKKLYEDFEQYKISFGEAKAKERYDKLINTDRTYLEFLADQQARILGYDDKAKGGDIGGGGVNTQQAKVLEEANKKALEAAQKRSDALLKEFMSYADKRKTLTESYNRDFKDLEANPGAQAERTKRYEKELKELDDANATKIASYEKMFEGIEQLSAKNALRLVQTARTQFAKDIKNGLIISPEEIKRVNDLFNKTEIAIREKNGQALKDMASEIGNVASAVSDIDEAFGKVLGTVGNVVGQLGNLKKGFADFKVAGKAGDSMGQLTAGLGIFGAGLSIFQSVFKLFDKSAQREEQASYSRDLQNKQTEALNKALERQVALLNDVYGTDRVRDYSAAIKQAQENQAKYANELAGKYALTGDKQLDDILSKINNGESIGFTSIDAFIKKNQAALDKLKLPSDLVSLQRLLDEGKLDANTATIVTNLIKAKETAEQLVNNLRAETVGTTLEQIADDFISTLTDGTQDFGKTFEQTIQKSILNGFKGEIIRKQLQAFYNQFADLSEGGLTSQEIETLRQSYLTASEKAKADLEALSKATGVDLTKDPSGNTSSSTGIARSQLTEETGQRIDGIMRAQYDATKLTNTILTPIGKSLGDLYLIAKGNFELQVKIEQNTFRTANNTDLLNNKLDAIISNTKPTVTPRGQGI